MFRVDPDCLILSTLLISISIGISKHQKKFILGLKRWDWCILSGDLKTRKKEKEGEKERDNKSEWQSRDLNQYFHSITLSPPLFIHVIWHHAVTWARPQRARQRRLIMCGGMWSWGIHMYTFRIPLPLLLRTQEHICLFNNTDSQP